MPQESPTRSPRKGTAHGAYDPVQANRLYQAFIRVASVYEQAQTGYWGKQTPVTSTGQLRSHPYELSGRPLQAPEGLPQTMTGSLDAELANVSFYAGSARRGLPSWPRVPPPHGHVVGPVSRRRHATRRCRASAARSRSAYDDVATRPIRADPPARVLPQQQLRGHRHAGRLGPRAARAQATEYARRLALPRRRRRNNTRTGTGRGRGIKPAAPAPTGGPRPPPRQRSGGAPPKPR